MLDLLIAFFVGLLISFLFWGWIYHQHKKAWWLEYRRLMAGIKQAFTDLYTLTSDDVVVIDQPKSADIGLQLQRLYNDEPVWPRS